MIKDGRYWLWRHGWGARVLVEVRSGRVRRFTGEHHSRSVDQYDDYDFEPADEAANYVPLNILRMADPLTGATWE